MHRSRLKGPASQVDALGVSADRLHESLRRLHASADALETGIALPAPVARRSAPATRAASAPTRRRSTARVVVFALAYPAASLAALTTALAVGDAAMPRPDAPHLAEPAPDAPAIPPLAANRP